MVSVVIFSSDQKLSKFQSWISEIANYKISFFLKLKSFFYVSTTLLLALYQVSTELVYIEHFL